MLYKYGDRARTGPSQRLRGQVEYITTLLPRIHCLQHAEGKGTSQPGGTVTAMSSISSRTAAWRSHGKCQARRLSCIAKELKTPFPKCLGLEPLTVKRTVKVMQGDFQGISNRTTYLLI